ncbi:bifunctional aminodeoxychorismate synthase component I/aminotransferase, partial [bacterium]|nr:bifunctional aminodeoxychorismate synthase component I/aminotransferase [bacterium]
MLLERAAIDFPAADGTRLRREFATPRATWIATEPVQVVAVLRAAEAEARDGRWVVGFVAYEAATAFDTALPTLPADPSLPLAAFAAYDEADELTPASGDFSCGPWTLTSRREFDTAIAAIHRGISAGRHYQVNFTTGLEAPFHGHPRALFEALRRAQPDGYCAYLDGGDWQLASVSPELFFDWTPEGRLTTRPMKGTAPRGHDAAEDQQRADELRRSEKEQAENLMIVDLLRNDLSRVARLGSVSVPRLFDLEALPTAWQMTSTVSCETRADVDLVQVFAALFPCGSVTGAPKGTAMAAISELEARPRGAYCGAIGLIRPGGHATFNVAIRTVAT